jgi:hypothetical protein
MSNPICFGHCFLEFPDEEPFGKHVDKVVRQRERRRKLYLYKKLKKEFGK